jgi:hypothetical protein
MHILIDNGKQEMIRLVDHPLYSRVCTQKGRCLCPTDRQYVRYGGRGIEFRFASNYDAIEYMMTLEGWDNHDLQCDRIDNDGHYEVGNLRFVTPRQNQHNKRNSQKVPGVFARYNGAFLAQCFINGKKYTGVVRKTIEEAKEDYDVMLKNFELYGVSPTKPQRDPDLLFIHKKRQKYAVRKTTNNQFKYYGTFNTLEEAQVFRDELVKNNWKI